MVNRIAIAAFLLLFLASVDFGYASDANRPNEMNFLFCDLGNNDDALVEARIKKTETEAYSRIGIYNLSTKTLHLYVPKTEQDWSSPRFSADAKQILFSYNKSKTERIACILDIATFTYKEISAGQHVKYMPAFSYDELSILYWSPDMAKNLRSGRNMHSLYKLNIASHNEVQLTDYAYLNIGHIVALSDMKTIVVGTERLDLYSKIGHKANSASYVIDAGDDNRLLTDNHQLAPGKDSAQFRSGSANDILIFTAATKDESGQHKATACNVYSSSGGKISQVTRYQPGEETLLFRHAAISRNGKRLIFETFPERVQHAPFYNKFAKLFGAEAPKPKPTNAGIFIINTDGSGMKKVEIPSTFQPVVHTVTRVQQ